MNSDSLTQWGFALREKWVNDRRTRAGFQRRISDHERVKVGILVLVVDDPVDLPRGMLLLDCMAFRAVRRIVQSLERILNPLAEILECNFHKFG